MANISTVFRAAITAASTGIETPIPSTSTVSLQAITSNSAGSIQPVVNVPYITATATAITGVTTPSTSNFALVLQNIIASGSTSNAGNSSANPQSITTASIGVTGNLGATGLSLPYILATGGGYIAQIGISGLSLPRILAQGVGVLSATTAYSTITMHTERQALTTYTNYPFNSFARFNGVYLGASGAGLFALSGATDNGTNIDSVARGGINDLGTSHLKKLEWAYVGYRSDGEMLFRVIVNEAFIRDYLIETNNQPGICVNRVHLGKGVISRYWQFELQNRFGSDFTLDVIEVKPQILSRRIGGNA